MATDDAEKYVAFFIASLVFFESYEQLQTLWTEQEDNRLALGIDPNQRRRMIEACAKRRAEIEAAPNPTRQR